MRSMEVTDEWLYQHMPVVDNAMITALENQVDREYVFSKRFEQKMQKVIRREAHPVLTGAQQLLKRMAIFFTGIVCAGLVLMLSVDAYRDKFFMTLKTLREDATQYNYSSEEKDAVLTPTIPTCIPEGYTETDRRDSPLFCEIFYENNAGEQLIWEQMLISSNNALTLVLDNEYDAEEEHVIGGHIATVYTYVDGYAMAYYEADNYVYVITADHMTAEEMYALVDFCEDYEHPLGFSFSDGGYVYLDYEAFHVQEKAAALEGCLKDGEDQDRHLLDMPFSAFGMLAAEDIAKFQAKYGYLGLQFLPYHVTGCDILRAGQDKATGLQALLDHLGLAAADCVAVGDGPNDAGMLALAGRSYCMADGMKTAKAAAKALAPAAAPDGIAQLCRSLWPEIFR